MAPHSPRGCYYSSVAPTDPVNLARNVPPGTLTFVIGESGSGKSAMLASLALMLMNERRVPIFRELTRASHGFTLSADEISIVTASSSNSILIVDALDQSTRPETVLNDIVVLITKYQIPALLSSRPLSLLGARSEPAFELRALEESEIKPFVTHIWSDQIAARIISELSGNVSTASLLELCRNPMILKMAATVVASAGQLKSKMQLYDDFTRIRLRYYQPYLTLSVTAVRQAAERVAYAVETKPGQRWGTLPASLASTEDISSPTDVHEQLAANLMRSGFTRVVGSDWEFLHRSYQSYFAARAVLQGLESPTAPDRSRVNQHLLPSEVSEFLGSYFDEEPERIQSLRSLLRPHGGFDYSDVNLRYIPVFCVKHPGEAIEMMKADLTDNRFEEGGTDFFREGAMLNSAMSGMLLGDSWCVGAWLSVIRRDHHDDSWNQCEYGGKFHNLAKYKPSWARRRDYTSLSRQLRKWMMSL